MSTLAERIKLAEKTTCKTNCIGFAFYLLGYIDPEKYVGYTKNDPHVKVVEPYLSRMTKIENPDLGDLVVFRNDNDKYGKRVEHMGLIIDFDPYPVICHRPGVNKKIQLRDDLRHIFFAYRIISSRKFGADLTMEYYRIS